MTVVDLPWTPVDPVGEALHHLRVTGVFYSRTEADGPWAVEMPAFGDCVSFHVVTVGEAWVEVEGAPPVRLVPGDLALVPHGRGHLLLSAPGVPSLGRVDELPQEFLSPNYSVLRHQGTGSPRRADLRRALRRRRRLPAPARPAALGRARRRPTGRGVDGGHARPHDRGADPRPARRRGRHHPAGGHPRDPVDPRLAGRPAGHHRLARRPARPSARRRDHRRAPRAWPAVDRRDDGARGRDVPVRVLARASPRSSASPPCST